MMKIQVAPESAIASFEAMLVSAAYAHCDCCAGATEENTMEKLEVEPDKTFDVMMVISSSLTITLCTGADIILGSDMVLITENVPLHLNATSPTIPPNHHIVGSIVLWRSFVMQLYPALMYCWAFCCMEYSL